MATQGVLLGRANRSRRTPLAPTFSIDWSHPLTNRLETLWMPATSFLPQFSKSGIGAVTQVTNARSTIGQGTKYGAGNNRPVYYLVPTGSTFDQGFTAPHTIAYVGQFRTGGSASQTAYGLRANTTDTPPYFATGFYYLSSLSTNFYCAIGGNGTATAQLNLNTSSSTHIGDHVYVVTARSGAQSFYLDGRSVASNTVTLVAPTLASPNIGFNNNPASLNNENSAVNVLGAIWTRDLTANEVAEFSANPFCFLRY